MAWSKKASYWGINKIFKKYNRFIELKRNFSDMAQKLKILYFLYRKYINITVRVEDKYCSIRYILVAMNLLSFFSLTTFSQ